MAPVLSVAEVRPDQTEMWHSTLSWGKDLGQLRQEEMGFQGLFVFHQTDDGRWRCRPACIGSPGAGQADLTG